MLYKFPVGVLWEDFPWELRTDYKYENHYEFSPAKPPCPHAKFSHESVVWNYGKTTSWKEYHWVIPRIIIGTNEGGYNSVGICLDCILAGISNLPEPEKETDNV